MFEFICHPRPEDVLDLEDGRTIWVQFCDSYEVAAWVPSLDCLVEECIDEIWVKVRWSPPESNVVGDGWEPVEVLEGYLVFGASLDPVNAFEPSPPEAAQLKAS